MRRLAVSIGLDEGVAMASVKLPADRMRGVFVRSGQGSSRHDLAKVLREPAPASSLRGQAIEKPLRTPRHATRCRAFTTHSVRRGSIFKSAAPEIELLRSEATSYLKQQV
jgi:hypothetical protein